MSVIDEVKQKTDIVEVVSQYAALKKAGRNLTAPCPFHSEKHPSFFVYPEQQSWHCFGACNTGGDVFSFVMKKEGIDFGEALRLLAQKAGVTIPSKREPDARKDEKEKLYQINEAATRYFHDVLLKSPEGEKARRYVASRGFSAKTIADFQLGLSLNSWGALKQHLTEVGYKKEELLTAGLVIEEEAGGTHDRFRNRLMFPIHDIRGHITGFGARVLDDSLPKYLNSPQTAIFDKSSILYGINLAAAAIRQQNVAVVVEGYMDVITAHQHGFNNVVASMGTSITEIQVSTIKKLTRNMVLALDADAAGEEAMLRGAGYENVLDAEIKVIVLPEEKDPDDVIKEDAGIWRQLGEGALPIIDYTFNMVTAKLDLTTARDKSLAVDRLLPVVAGIKDIARQAHYLQKLAHLVKVSERTMEAALKGVKASRGRHSVNELEPRTSTPSPRLFMSSPREEYCLALLMRYPELKGRPEELPLEFFESSENRELYVAWQETKDLSSLKANLDFALHEHLDTIVSRDLPGGNVEQRYADCVRELRIKYLKSLAAKKAEAGGTGLSPLEEDLKISTQLREVFTQKSSGGRNK